jgi:hypothetical protein
MKDTIIILTWTCGAISIIIGLVVHLKEVIPTLEKYGRKALWPALPSKQFRQCREYKDICIEYGLSLRYWRILTVSQITAGIALIVWVTIFLVDVLNLISG